MYSRIACSSLPTVDTKYPLAQKCWPTKLRFRSPVDPGQVDRTLSFDVPHNLRHRIFGWDRDHHMHVIRHQMSLFNAALLLRRELSEHLPQVPSQLAIQRLPPALWNEDHVVFALPFRVA